MQDYVLWYEELGMNDVGRVGGKNASLGEMISNLANAGVQVPEGTYYYTMKVNGVEYKGSITLLR